MSYSPRLRRLPVPACEPPFDDETSESPSGPAGALPSDAVQGTLALAFVLPTGVPAVPDTPPDLRLVPPPDAQQQLDEDEFGPQPTSRADLPAPRPWAGRFVQALVEVLAGDRPVGQLVRWTSAAVYDDVSARLVARPVVPHVGCEPSEPRAVVRSVHVTEPGDGVAEVAALVRRGVRCTAIALRIEGLDGRWQCTALQLG